MMASTGKVFKGPGSRSGRTRNTVIVAVIFGFLGLARVCPGAAGQGLDQNLNQSQGTLRNPQQSRFPVPGPPDFPKANRKQKQALLDLNFKKLKKHADDLAELANSLQKEIEKSNENVLSLEIVKKAEQAEKLARQIKEEAKGY